MGILTSNKGEVRYTAIRWSEEGALRALVEYLHEEDGETRHLLGMAAVAVGPTDALELEAAVTTGEV